MKDLCEREHIVVGGALRKGFEKRRHLRLPTRVDGVVFHARGALLEVLGLQIADEQAVRPQKQRVVAPSGLAQRIQHFRPHVGVARLVLLHLLRADLQQKTDAHWLSFILRSSIQSARLPPRPPTPLRFNEQFARRMARRWSRYGFKTGMGRFLDRRTLSIGMIVVSPRALEASLPILFSAGCFPALAAESKRRSFGSLPLHCAQGPVAQDDR